MPAEEHDLFALWRRAAPRATDGELALLAGFIVPWLCGVLLAAVVKPELRRLWPLSVVLLLVSAFGIWGIAEREIRDRHGSSHGVAAYAWRALRAAATVIAGTCVALTVLLILRLTMGTWIS